MGAELNAEVKIPDLWYDVYARLLPGSAFVAIAYLLFAPNPEIPTTSGIFLLLCAGFFTGLTAQPISSELTAWIHHCVARVHGEERLFVDIVRARLDERQVSIIDKMHGETTFFVQCFVLGLLLCAIRLLSSSIPATTPSIVWIFVASVFFLFGAIEFSDRRFRRVRDRIEVTRNQVNQFPPG